MRLVVFLLIAIAAGVKSQFGGLGGFGNLANLPKQAADTSLNQASQLSSGIPGANQVTGALRSALEGQWNNFQSLKKYADEAEKELRKNVFLANGAAIDAFNKGSNSFVQGLNDFADLAQDEFVKLCTGFKLNLAKLASFVKGTPFTMNDTKAIPDHVDWREKGAVSPVKQQGVCNSCYAFSSTGALEGQHFRKTGQLIELSPQNLMDCSKKFGNDGCDGGFTEASFEYTRTNKGVSKFNSYPYEGVSGQCRYDPNSVGTDCKGYGFVPEGNEKALQAAVATLGPIAIAIHAEGMGFQFYKSGIYYNPECRNGQGDLNHAMLLVGYGTDAKTGQKYWLVKNSHGANWGENGYFRIIKDANNHCGIATYARYPIL